MLDALLQALQNPALIAVFAVQLLLGVALGYIAVKAFKYVLAFIMILVTGTVLNVWSLGLSLEKLSSELGEYALQARDIIFKFAGTLGLLTVGPVTVGFLIGALAAWLRK